MITLYHAPQTRSSRFVWLLEELGQPYEIRQVSIFRPMSGEGGPDAVNPHPDKQVPALVRDGELVAESVAIALYLTDAFPEADLGPVVGDPRRGAYLTWLAWYAAAVEPAVAAKVSGELDGDLPGAALKRRAYEAVVRRLETTLAQGPYALGDRFSAADVLISSALHWARRAFPESAVLDAYAERCRMRPAALRAVQKDTAEGLQTPG